MQTRLFRPVNIQLTTSENSITAKWTDMQGATGYYVELYTSENVTADDGEKYATKTLVASETNLQGASWTLADLEF